MKFHVLVLNKLQRNLSEQTISVQELEVADT